MAEETPAHDETLPITPAGPRVEGETASGEPQPLPAIERARYDLLGEIGRGGVGRVLEAHDRRLDRAVAIKELRTDDRQAERRFVREALMTARLEHPSIVPIHDLATWEGGAPVYVMKRVAGRSLEEVVAERREASQRLALLPHVLAVAEAVAYAHSRGVIHRDLKPANVLVGEFGETVVVDWGMARDLAEPDELAGAVLGTPAYMPPEQARGEPVDRRADVYALGALLYHVLAGRPPYKAAAALAEVRRGPPAPLVGPPRELVAIVDRAMARVAAARYPSAAELAEDLRRFQTGRLVEAHRYSTLALVARWVKRNRVAVSVAAVLSASLAATAAVAVSNIVAERNAAVAATRRADEAARGLAARNDALVLEAARARLPTDPTATLGWLKRYLISGGDVAEVRRLGAEAVAAGVASRVFRGHTRSIYRALLSPDGRQIVSGAYDATVVLWDVASGRRQLLADLPDLVISLAMSRDGRWVAAAAKVDKVHLFELPSGRHVELPSPSGRVVAVTFFPDGTLLSSDVEGNLRLWDVSARTERLVARCPGLCDLFASPDGKSFVARPYGGDLSIVKLPGGESLVVASTAASPAVAYSPDGKQIVTGHADGTVRVWSAATGLPVLTLAGHTAAVNAVAFAPGGKLVASAGDDRTVLLWDLVLGGQQRLAGHSASISELAFSPDGTRLASAAGDATVRLWPVNGGEPRVLRGHENAVLSLDFARDGNALVTGSDDNSVRLWPTHLAEERVLGAHDEGIGDLAFSPDGRWVVSTSTDRTVRLWPVDGGAARVLAGHPYPVNSATFSPDGKWLASSGQDLRLWNLATGEGRVLGDGPPSALYLRPVFSENGIVAAGRWNGEVRWFELASGASGALVGHSARAWAVAITRDGSRIVSGAADGSVRSWTRDGAPGRVLSQEDGLVRRVAFSPDEKLIAWCTVKGAVKLMPAAGGPVRALAGHTDMVHDVRFSADGRWLVTPSNDNTARVWDVATGEVRVLRHPDGRVLNAAFSADGSVVATAGNSVRLWDTKSGRLLVVRHTPAAPDQVAISTRGQLAYGGDDKQVSLIDIAPWLLPTGDAALVGWLGSRTSAAIDRDGRATSP